MSEQTIVEAQRLVKIYRKGASEIRPLDGLDLEVAAGECLADGTYRPGIRARLDHDGRLWLVGRGDLLTEVGGQWVNAGLLLQALHIHPWVTRARVIATRGEPNKRKQKLTVAVAGRDDHDVDLQSHCRRTLGQTIPLQVIKTDRRAIPRGLSIT